MEWLNFAVNAYLSDPSGNQLGHLGAEVDDENTVRLHHVVHVSLVTDCANRVTYPSSPFPVFKLGSRTAAMAHTEGTYMDRKTTRQKPFAKKPAPVPNVPVATYTMQVGTAVWPTRGK